MLRRIPRAGPLVAGHAGRRPCPHVCERHPPCSSWRANVSAKAPLPKALQVTVVSGNPETLAGLEAYLRSAGVDAIGTCAIERVLEMTAPSTAAVILFPDAYAKDDVTQALATLHRGRPRALTVIVTNEPSRFERGSTSHAGDDEPLVIPKPAWAWTILDAVRARLYSSTLPR